MGFYMGGNLISFAGDGPWDDLSGDPVPDTITTDCLYQNYTTNHVEMCGGGWDAQLLLPNGTLTGSPGTLPYYGNSNSSFFGTEIGRAGFVGGYTGGALMTNTATTLFAPAQYNPTLVPGTTDAVYMTIASANLYPTSMPPGMYDLRAFTYGYVQDKGFSVYVSSGQVADMKINLVIGVNVTLDILFKKEHIIAGTPDGTCPLGYVYSMTRATWSVNG